MHFDEIFNSDTDVNGGIYGFSEDSEANEFYDLEMLGVKYRDNEDRFR